LSSQMTTFTSNNRINAPRRAQKMRFVGWVQHAGLSLGLFFLSCLTFYVSLIGISHLGESETEKQAKVLFQLVWQAHSPLNVAMDFHSRTL
jgi:hypothetical protein